MLCAISGPLDLVRRVAVYRQLVSDRVLSQWVEPLSVSRLISVDINSRQKIVLLHIYILILYSLFYILYFLGTFSNVIFNFDFRYFGERKEEEIEKRRQHFFTNF